jgi:hypothetical protein
MTKNDLIGTFWLCGATLVLCLGAAVFFQSWRPVSVGLAVSLLLILPSFLSLSWAFKKSNKIFYSVYAGGFFGRFLGFAATAAVVFLNFKNQATAVLIALAAGLAVLSFIESVYIQKRIAL